MPQQQMYNPNMIPHSPLNRYSHHGVGRDEILMVSDDRVLSLRTAAGPQRLLSDNASMVSIPR